MRRATHRMSRLVFRSKVDGWFRVVSLGGGLVPAAVLAILAAEAERAALWLAPALLILAAMSPWLLRTTDYTLTDRHLRIRSGPFRWRVLLADVRSVTPTRNPLSSPALSLDRLRIEYGRGLAVMVSPSDKERFIEELRARAPRLARV